MSEAKEKLEQEEALNNEKATETSHDQAEKEERESVFTPEEREEIASADAEEILQRLADKKSKIEELEKQVHEMKDAHLRKVAELENMKKRIRRERTQVFETAKINALEDFLPINDDLHRTLNASEGLDIDDKFLDGVKMVARKFEDVLEKHDVKRIDETMVPFDVDLHEAMMKQPAPSDDIESDTVLQVIENGYRIGDRTIRHAKVIVSE